MRVAILGAGAVGGTLAALLARRGHEIEITARGANLAAIRRSGIHLSGAWGDSVAAVSAAERLGRTPELALVTTKAVDAPAAIRENEKLLRGIPLLVVQNGLSGISAAVAAAPKADVVGGLAFFAASFLTPGEVTVTAGGALYVGNEPQSHDVPARFVAQVLGEVIETQVVADFAGAQWSKLVVNQVNALPAITGLSVQQVVADRALLRVLTASIRETVRVARANDIRFSSINGLSNRMLRFIGVAPLAIGQALPRAMARRMGATPNPGSTLQSIRRGQPTEIDYLNGAVVEAAKGTSMAAPVNSALVEMVHEVEKSGAFLTADEVTKRALR
jgi:2-dehydropantoate 2-reductase